jgi:peptide/nickel transport system permease protein
MSVAPSFADVEREERFARAARRRVRWRYVRRRLARDPIFLIGAAVLLFWIVMALGWRQITPYDPFAFDALRPLQGPSWAHWFGTDDLGRDVLSRVLAGAAPVLSVAPLATLLSIVLGTIVGLVSGYYRGIADDVIMRLVDALLAFPVIIIAVIVLALLGSSTLNMVLVIAILFMPNVARTVRSAVLAERERPYVEATRLRGESGLYVMFVEILPNVTSPIVVEATIRLGYAVFTAATLAFLALGVHPPSPDWGLTIALDRVYVQVAWWTVIFPALALASLVVSVNLIADSLRRTVAE